jgi:hypothetical protein
LDRSDRPTTGPSLLSDDVRASKPFRTADSASDQRSGVFTCWRGNAAGLGGWTFVTRISLSTLQATGMAFFGLYGSTAALATTLT